MSILTTNYFQIQPELLQAQHCFLVGGQPLQCSTHTFARAVWNQGMPS